MSILQKRESLCPVGIKLDLQRRIQDHSHFKTIYIYLASCESSYTTCNAYQKDKLRGLTSVARIRVPVPLCAPFSYNRLFLLSSHMPVESALPQTILDPKLMKSGIRALVLPPTEELYKEQL